MTGHQYESVGKISNIGIRIWGARGKKMLRIFGRKISTTVLN